MGKKSERERDLKLTKCQEMPNEIGRTYILLSPYYKVFTFFIERERD